jgi:hypothetical protein
MRKTLYWILKIISILLLIVPGILCLPGFIFHILSEEVDGESFEDKMTKDINDL